MAFLPWWLGAPALAAVTVGYFALTRRTLGVSGSFERALDARRVREHDRAAEELERNEEELRRALLEATLEEFGTLEAPPASREVEHTAPLRPLPWASHVVFIAALFAGALATALVTGRASLRTEPDATYAIAIAGGWKAWAVLAAGGVLVGFGARIAGGCTSGHGLSGCSRFQPGSLVATATFVGCAVLVSLALAWVAS